MQRLDALRILGLPDQAAPFTPEQIATAFRKAVVKIHPDTTGMVASVPPNLCDYQEARKLLILNLNGQNNACPQCRGRGYIPAKFGTRSCGACKGTGDKVG